MAYHFIIFVHISGTKINKNVNDKHDVNNKVNDRERFRVSFLDSGFVLVLLLLTQKKSGGIRSEDRSVDHQQQNNPVPDSFEW